MQCLCPLSARTPPPAPCALILGESIVACFCQGASLGPASVTWRRALWDCSQASGLGARCAFSVAVQPASMCAPRTWPANFQFCHFLLAWILVLAGHGVAVIPLRVLTTAGVGFNHLCWCSQAVSQEFAAVLPVPLFTDQHRFGVAVHVGSCCSGVRLGSFFSEPQPELSRDFLSSLFWWKVSAMLLPVCCHQPAFCCLGRVWRLCGPVGWALLDVWPTTS